jgi:hypothetical protein
MVAGSCSGFVWWCVMGIEYLDVLLYAIAMARVGKLTGEKGSTAVMVRGGKGRSVDVAAGAEED